MDVSWNYGINHMIQYALSYTHKAQLSCYIVTSPFHTTNASTENFPVVHLALPGIPFVVIMSSFCLYNLMPSLC
jgi:hypothetical protein